MQARDPLIFNGVHLEENCQSCHGVGHFMECGLSSLRKNTCGNCDGRGVVLTDDGNAMLILVAEYLTSANQLTRK